MSIVQRRNMGSCEYVVDGKLKRLDVDARDGRVTLEGGLVDGLRVGLGPLKPSTVRWLIPRLESALAQAELERRDDL